MKTLGRSLTVGAAVVLLATAAIPGFAQGSHGGGGGGGHASSGGAHFGGGGGHVASAPHFAAPAYHSGFAGFNAHSAYASRPNVSYASAARYSPGLGSGAAHVGNWGGHTAAVTRPGNFGHYGPGAAGWRYGRWGGGYWRGGYWPPVFWGAGFAWFLPVLPAFCATYWWDSVPYYYYNDVYYTWSPTADGYVVTNPPPAAADAPPPDAQAAPPADNGDGAIPPGAGYSQPPPNASAPAQGAYAPPPSSDRLYAYPKNGQTADQQALDRRECEQWASSEVSSGSSNASPAGIDYRRAMSACLQGRGYSVN